jgi:nitrile hydratase
MAGFGSIEIESDEPVFHHAWEARAFGLNVLSIGLLGAYNADEYRHSIERMDPAHYLAASYYERVLTGVASLLVEKGLVTREDLEARAGGPFPLARGAVANHESPGSGNDAPRFAVGDLVTAPFKFPDDSAHGGQLRKEHTYHVEFDAVDLWGESAGMNETVIVDLWETYLEEAR